MWLAEAIGKHRKGLCQCMEGARCHGPLVRRQEQIANPSNWIEPHLALHNPRLVQSHHTIQAAVSHILMIYSLTAECAVQRKTLTGPVAGGAQPPQLPRDRAAVRPLQMISSLHSHPVD